MQDKSADFRSIQQRHKLHTSATPSQFAPNSRWRALPLCQRHLARRVCKTPSFLPSLSGPRWSWARRPWAGGDSSAKRTRRSVLSEPSGQGARCCGLWRWAETWGKAPSWAAVRTALGRIWGTSSGCGGSTAGGTACHGWPPASASSSCWTCCGLQQCRN